MFDGAQLLKDWHRLIDRGERDADEQGPSGYCRRQSGSTLRGNRAAIGCLVWMLVHTKRGGGIFQGCCGGLLMWAAGVARRGRFRFVGR